VRNLAKQQGVVYTPSSLARRILREARLTAGKAIPVVCDPACGSGAILAEAARVLSTLPMANAKSALRNLTGFDIDRKALAECRKRLDAAIRPRMGSWKCGWNLIPLDILSTSKLREYQGHFTHVVGNPPYVRVQNLEAKRRATIQRNWKLGEGATDLFIIFFEAGLDLLRLGGMLSYITPSSWMKSQAGAPLRETLLQEHSIRKIIDFGDRQMFPGVTTYTAITAVQKGLAQTAEKIAVELPGRGKGLVQQKQGNPRAPWAIITKDQKTKFERMQKGGTPLIELADIFVGVQTLADKVFILPKTGRENGLTWVETPDGEKILLETAFLRPIVKASVAREGKDLKERVLIYPYDKNGQAIAEETLRKQASRIYGWLLANKKTLLARDKGTFDPEKWFHFGRKVSITTGFGKKILTSGISQKPNFQLFKNPRQTFYSGYAVKPRRGICIEKLLRELNSERMDFHVRSTSRCLQHGWMSYAKSHIKDFPVAVPRVRA